MRASSVQGQPLLVRAGDGGAGAVQQPASVVVAGDEDEVTVDILPAAFLAGNRNAAGAEDAGGPEICPDLLVQR